MNRGQFERIMDAFARPGGEHRDTCYQSNNNDCCLNWDAVRDFIWEKVLKRGKTVRKNCKHCGMAFPISRVDQEFHSPTCKAAFFQEKRRKEEKGKKDYET